MTITVEKVYSKLVEINITLDQKAIEEAILFYLDEHNYAVTGIRSFEWQDNEDGTVTCVFRLNQSFLTSQE